MDRDFLMKSRSPPQVEAMVGTEQPTRWRGAGPGRRVVGEEPWSPARDIALPEQWVGWVVGGVSPAKLGQMQLPDFSCPLLHLPPSLLAWRSLGFVWSPNKDLLGI